MKRKLILLFLLMLVFGVIGCGNNGNEKVSEKETAQEIEREPSVGDQMYDIIL